MNYSQVEDRVKSRFQYDGQFVKLDNNIVGECKRPEYANWSKKDIYNLQSRLVEAMGFEVSTDVIDDNMNENQSIQRHLSYMAVNVEYRCLFGYVEKESGE